MTTFKKAIIIISFIFILVYLALTIWGFVKSATNKTAGGLDFTNVGYFCLAVIITTGLVSHVLLTLNLLSERGTEGIDSVDFIKSNSKRTASLILILVSFVPYFFMVSGYYLIRLMTQPLTFIVIVYPLSCLIWFAVAFAAAILLLIFVLEKKYYLGLKKSAEVNGNE